jgi:subtilisin family serine protease
MRIKVQLSATPRLLATDAGDHLGPYAIVQTVPGGEHVILDAPDWSDEQLDALVRDWQRQGLVVDDGNGLWRHERTDYVPLGFVAPSGWYQVGDGPRMPVGPTFAPGDTFPLLGITEDIRRRGKYGSGVLLGLCDTGLAGDHPWFAGKSLEGDLTDSHGHGTHVAGTMAGAQGIASDAAIYSQNVLPGVKARRAG